MGIKTLFLLKKKSRLFFLMIDSAVAMATTSRGPFPPWRGLKEETLKSHGLENVSIVELFFFFFFINRYTFFWCVCQGIEEEEEEVLGVFSPAQQVHTRQTLYLGREEKKTLIDLGGKPQDILLLFFLSFFFLKKFGEYLGWLRRQSPFIFWVLFFWCFFFPHLFGGEKSNCRVFLLCTLWRFTPLIAV